MPNNKVYTTKDHNAFSKDSVITDFHAPEHNLDIIELINTYYKDKFGDPLYTWSFDHGLDGGLLRWIPSWHTHTSDSKYAYNDETHSDYYIDCRFHGEGTKHDIGYDKLYPGVHGLYCNDQKCDYGENDDCTVTGSWSENGFGRCDLCGDLPYQPCDSINGVYQISNVGQLYWFANKVNVDHNFHDAVLTKDIDFTLKDDYDYSCPVPIAVRNGKKFLPNVH